ncbi:MAG TPA: VWA domain-containing protein [Steroidobacteraceae bacterium]|nr:VWA domain-containing protein [Steroidobacteraceae bacterium]
MTDREASMGVIVSSLGRESRDLRIPGRWCAAAAAFIATLALAACGGGGGGGGGDGGGGGTPPPAPTGSVQVTVVDQFNTGIQNADVTITVGSATRTGRTAASGIVTVSNVPTGSASVAVTAAGFIDPAANSVTVTENQTVATNFSLLRVTQPAAGLFGSQITAVAPGQTGDTLEFSITVLVVDENGVAFENLNEGNFALQPCTVDAATPDADCIRGDALADDASYTVVNPTPVNLTKIPAQPAQPYAAMLLIDQSQSIQNTDPTNARLFATKVFMQNLGVTNGVEDLVAVSAFAQTEQPPPSNAIPDQPVTDLTPGFIGSATVEDYFDDIDVLATQERGETPLFESLDQQLQYTFDNAPTAGNRSRAVVLFTDGEDSTCKSSDCGVDDSVLLSQQLGVDIFTVGLGTDIDANTMQALAQGGNGYFLFAENAEQLFPIYDSLGRLLSRALTSWQMTWTIEADRQDAFAAGSIVLGTLRISTGENDIDLPIRVFLPTP